MKLQPILSIKYNVSKQEDLVHSQATHPTKPLLFIGHHGGLIQGWNTETNTLCYVLNQHTYLVNTLCLQDDFLISGSMDNTICIWDLKTSECLRVLNCPNNSIVLNSVPEEPLRPFAGKRNSNRWRLAQAFPPEKNLEKTLFATCYENIKIWNFFPEESPMNLVEHKLTIETTSPVYSMITNPYTGILATGLKNSSIELWNWSGEHIKTLNGHNKSISSLATSETWLVSGSSEDKTIRIWSWITGECVRKIDNTQKMCNALVLKNNFLLIHDSYYNSNIFLYETPETSPNKWENITTFKKSGNIILDNKNRFIYISSGEIIIYEDPIKLQQIEKTKIIKEELIRKVWHPNRVCRWIEAGYDPTDF